MGVADLIVVVDVLTFGTAVSVAVDRGARVIPYARRDGTAPARAKALGATLASPNRGAKGPTLSPASLVDLRAGERLLVPDHDAAACVAIAADAGVMVVVGCLRNASAVGRLVAARNGTTAVIAVGGRWADGGLRLAAEDLVGAGAILDGVPAEALSPEALAAVGAFRASYRSLREAVGESGSGRQLREAGFERDLDLAAAFDATTRVPVLVDGMLTGGLG